MPTLLLELGTEELPASAVRKAYQELASRLQSLLIDARVLEAMHEVVSMGTPRRLIVSINGLKDGQEDSIKGVRGPGVKAAYDSQGNPTQALQGFCRGQGVGVEDLRQDGQYFWITKKIQGSSTLDLLPEIFSKAIRSLTFEKTMRWGSSKMRFARPIRWVLALLDGVIVPFEIEGIRSSNQSFGHRFYSPGFFPVESLTDLLAKLRQKQVEPEPSARRSMILEDLPLLSNETAELSDALVDENVFLTEWPKAICGKFSQSFLELPVPVLSTVMAKHERMFPVKNSKGELTNRFIFIRNSGEDEFVRRGTEWVLNARMNDAKFFFDEDKRHPLSEFREKTRGILFQERLGTVFARSERLEKLAAQVFVDPVEDAAETEYAAIAGKFSKADLSTGLVSELTSLQGVIGGVYARREEMADPICWAISSQYDPTKNQSPACAGGRTAVRLLVADQIDKLAGYLCIGLEPTGSSDPYGLRRAITVLIEAAWGWASRTEPLVDLFEISAELYKEQAVNLDLTTGKAALERLFRSRYGSLMPGVRHDVLEAALPKENLKAVTSPREVRFRTHLLSKVIADPSLVQTATRPINIVAAARKKDVPVTNQEDYFADLDSPTGTALYQSTLQQHTQMAEALRSENVDQAYNVLQVLQDPITAFFQETMIMADDIRTRSARLALLEDVSKLLFLAADFSKIVFDGER